MQAGQIDIAYNYVDPITNTSRGNVATGVYSVTANDPMNSDTINSDLRQGRFIRATI
ncbi:MAG: hypothetical protein HZB24_06675 [Desulfobacterales bacterium]|nr:hypothetical protein [Desulfobacterales bacterium]